MMKLFFGMIAAFSISALALPDEFEDQSALPGSGHSNLVCTRTAVADDRETIIDRELADALHDALGDNGFHSFIGTFDTCFGGGLMDDVRDAFSNSLQPMSMTSGAKHFQPAGTKPSTGSGKDNSVGRWSQSYQGVHDGIVSGTNQNPTQNDAYTQAKQQPV